MRAVIAISASSSAVAAFMNYAAGWNFIFCASFITIDVVCRNFGGFSSSAHVARLVQAPVILVVDCAAVARSVGAIVHGFSRFDDTIRVAGVILNNVASPRHEAEARHGVAETGVPVLGVIPRLPEVVVPSRHLGLIPVAERQPAATEAVAALSSMARTYVDLDALAGRARGLRLRKISIHWRE